MAPLSSEIAPPISRRKEDAREALLEAALTCFSERGLEGASIREIAALAGQNSASISYHFGSKEKLYRAVLHEALSTVNRLAREIDCELQVLKRRGTITAEDAIQLLERFFGSIFQALVQCPKGARLAPLILREQTRPTEAFEILYSRGIRQSHELIATLTGVVLDRPSEDAQTILHAHGLFGQFVSLIATRETLLRRMDWEDFSEERADQVLAALETNIRALLTGLQLHHSSNQSP